VDRTNTIIEMDNLEYERDAEVSPEEKELTQDNLEYERDTEVSPKDKELTPGIIYLNSIPPGMKPTKIRTIFSQFGEVGRLFLQPEDELTRKKRKKNGGNGRKKFTEGWVEFKDRKIAKAVARSLNTTNIGGKKRYYYHDDIWNIKYLPKFKWGHISEKLAYEKASREQRMRTEISQAKREASSYLDNVGKKRAIEAMKKRKAERLGQKATESVKESSSSNTSSATVTDRFHQNTVLKQKSQLEGKSSGSPQLVSSDLLSKIFSAR